MGSSTVRCLSRLALCLFFALSFFSCESGEDSELTSEPAASAATHSFDSLVRVKLMVPDLEGGAVELRSNEQLGRILAQYDGGGQGSGVRAQTFEPYERIGQQINPDSASPIIVQEHPRAFPDGEPELYINSLYNSRSANIGGAVLHNPSFAAGDEDDSFSSYTARTVWSYSQTDGTGSNGKIGVVVSDLGQVGDAERPNSAPIVNGGSGAIEVVADWTFSDLPDQPSEGGITYTNVNVVISVEGTEVFSASGVRTVMDNSSLPILPVFESVASGTYRFTAEDTYSSPIASTNFTGGDFTQKGLALADPLQDYELTPGVPAQISNSFAWDYGDNPTDLQEASWDVKITNPAGVQVALVSGTGRTIAATLDTGALGAVGPFRLKPKGRETPDGGSPIYAYEIVIRALAYDSARVDYFAEASREEEVPYDDVFYEVSSVVAPTELKIINIELDPDPPFQNEGDSVEVTAEILAIGFENLAEEDITWWVELLDPSGEPVGDPLATGDGFAVSATWDGKVEGVAVADPGSYTLRIRATTCDGVSPQRVQVRAQQACPPVAQAIVGLTGPRMVVSGKAITGSTTTIKEVGYGFEPTLLETRTGGDSHKQRLRREALQDVHLLEESATGGLDLTLEVQVEFPQGTDPPALLTLQARNMLTGALLTKDAVQKAPGEKVYRIEPGDPFNLPRAFIDADSVSGGPALTRYSIGEIYRDKAKLVPPKTLLPGKPGGTDVTSGVTEAFMRLIESSNAFPGPRVFLGKFAETAIDADTLTEIYPYRDTGGLTGESTGGSTAPLTPPARIPTILDLVNAPLDDPLRVAYRALTTVTSKPENLLKVGFVPIEITVSEVDTNKDPEPLSPVYFKVPRLPELAALNIPSRTSNVVLWTYHGNHDGALGVAEDRNRVVPPAQQMTPRIGPTTNGMATSLKTVHTLILTSCDALDINDFNSGKVLRDSDGYPTEGIPGTNRIPPGANQRRYGGELWDQVMATATKTQQNQLGQDAVILGYNDVSPLIRDDNGKPVNSMAEIMTMFEEELQDLAAAGVPANELRQKAWMAANVKFADTTSGTASNDAKWNALHATAIDKDHYYYIPHLKDRTSGVGGAFNPVTGRVQIITLDSVLREVKKTDPVYRVKRHPVWPSDVRRETLPSGAVPEWGVYGPGTANHDLSLDFARNRDKFAEKVPIPGLTFSKGTD